MKKGAWGKKLLFRKVLSPAPTTAYSKEVFALAIPASVIDDIRNRCDIESVISGYVSLKRAGANSKGLCPFHSEKTPSFTVYNETQSFYCFGCGAGGDVFTFLMKIENIGYMDAVGQLASKAGINLDAYSKNSERGVSKSRILAMNLEAAKYYREILFSDQIGAPGRAYLAERGMSMAAIKRFGIGYAPEKGAVMTGHLKKLGFSDEEIKTGYLGGKGEYGYYDMYRARIMFPIIDVTGNVIAFGGRIIDSSKSDRKYLNTSDTPAFKKTRNLYALNYAKNSQAGYFILCEGYMDVIAMHDAGFGSAVASLGTAFTDEQARIIAHYVKRVILCYDSDEAGQKATNKAISILENVGIEAKILKMTGAKDPDEYIKKYGKEEFGKLIEASRGRLDFFIDGLRTKYNFEDAQEKIKAVAEASYYLAGIYSDVERDIYIEKTAKEMAVASESLKADTMRRRRKLLAESDKKRHGELVRIVSGSGDRVNPDFASRPAEARTEEGLLGIMFLHPEFTVRETDGRKLSSDELPTELGRRMYSFVSAGYSEGNYSFGQLGGEFTPDEVARAARMMAHRTELASNDENAWDEFVRAIRRAGEESGNNSLEDILERRRNKEGI